MRQLCTGVKSCSLTFADLLLPAAQCRSFGEICPFSCAVLPSG